MLWQSLLLILCYLASVGVVVYLLRSVSAGKDWSGCIGMAAFWPWHVLRLAGCLAYAWWEEREYD